MGTKYSVGTKQLGYETTRVCSPCLLAISRDKLFCFG